MPRPRITCVTIALIPLLSACGPSKETKCHEIADYRAKKNNSPNEAPVYYFQCMNAPHKYAHDLYKEIKEGKNP